MTVHAHPDDEASKGAPTLARYHAEGVHTVLVCCTGGEEGDLQNPHLREEGQPFHGLPAEEERSLVASMRPAELSASAEVIGFDEVIMLGYRDSGMPDTEHNEHQDAFVNVPFDEVLARLVEIVRREQPEIVLGYDDHERYPHPDHLRVHDLSLAVFEAAADPAYGPDLGAPWEIVKLYAPTFTARRIKALHDAVVARGLESPFERWLEGLEGYTEDGKIVSRIDVTGYIDRARLALRAHATQVDPDGFWFQVPTPVVEAAYPYEDFELLASRVDVTEPERSLFANIPGHH